MAVKQVREGWISTLTGRVYDSEKACRHYDDNEALRARAQNDPAEAALAKLSTEEIKAIALVGSASVVAQANAEQNKQTFGAWLEEHPEFVKDGEPGYANGNAMETFLRLEGKESWTDSDLDNAYAEMRDRGMLHIDKKVKPAKVEDPSERYISPLDTQDLEMRRIDKKARSLSW